MDLHPAGEFATWDRHFVTDWGAAQCVVIAMRSRPHMLAEFTRRWRRVNDRSFDVFEAVENHRAPIDACYDSHLQLLQQSTRPLAVFEEDAVFRSSFTLDLQPPEDADIIRLGGEHQQLPIAVAAGWVRPTMVVRSHAYLVADPQLLAKHLCGRRPYRHVDHALARVPLRQLALERWSVGQGAGVSTIENRTYRQHRFWDL